MTQADELKNFTNRIKIRDTYWASHLFPNLQDQLHFHTTTLNEKYDQRYAFPSRCSRVVESKNLDLADKMFCFTFSDQNRN